MRFQNLLNLRFALLPNKLLPENRFLNDFPKHNMFIICLIMQEHLLVEAEVWEAVNRPLAVFDVLFQLFAIYS
jgi:hypothetical protein